MIAQHRQQKNRIKINRGQKAKNWLFPVMILVLTKVVCLIYFTDEPEKVPLYEIFNSEVSAQEDIGDTQNTITNSNKTAVDNGARKTEPGGVNEWNLDLIRELQKREALLHMKEEAIKKEEERLKEIKRQIDNRIEALSEVERKITKLVETKKAVEDEKILKLAKVFEATPPEQAGPLLSKLDIDIAAQLILKMASRKAGKIWGFVDTDKAVKISKVLARLNPDFDINSIKGKK